LGIPLGFWRWWSVSGLHGMTRTNKKIKDGMLDVHGIYIGFWPRTIIKQWWFNGIVHGIRYSILQHSQTCRTSMRKSNINEGYSRKPWQWVPEGSPQKGKKDCTLTISQVLKVLLTTITSYSCTKFQILSTLLHDIVNGCLCFFGDLLSAWYGDSMLVD
jgi:hypothetical protein